MTQQYIVGEFSSLLGDLERAPGGQLAAVHDLRQAVEHSPASRLPVLAEKAMELMDLICWAMLERGDASRFSDYAKGATALREFSDNARLLP